MGVFFYPWVMNQVWAGGAAAHHLAADWDCAAMMMWEGPPSTLWCWPIPASTDMAMASAAALVLKPFWPTEGLGAKELCWITGAGEPVGSDVSFRLSSAAAENRKIIKKKIKNLYRKTEQIKCENWVPTSLAKKNTFYIFFAAKYDQWVVCQKVWLLLWFNQKQQSTKAPSVCLDPQKKI